MKKVLTVGVVLTVMVWTLGAAAFVPAASAATLSAGDLIKASGAAVYYYAADGQRYTFPTESTYKSWYSDFSGIKTITDNELSAIDLAGNVVMRAGTNLIKIDTVPKVYAVGPNGDLYWVKTEAVAKTLYGDNWNKKIVTVPDGFWTNYTDTGTELDGSSYPEGALIKWAAGADTYYVNANGTHSKVATEAAFNANNWKWADVLAAPVSITLNAGADVTERVATYVDVSQGGGAGTGTTVTTGTGTLTVALAADTPASTSVADQSNANFTKFKLTASGSAIEVSKIRILKTGYSATSDVENIKITDTFGVSLSSTGSLNTDGSVTLSFNPVLTIAAGSTNEYFVKSGIINDATGGLTVAFKIDSASDVTSTAATVAGNFPVQGNAMTVVQVTIGSASVTWDEVLTDTTPDSGDKNLVINSFKVTAGTTESITIESLTFKESGTASLTDTSNIELWSVTDNKSLGEVASWGASGKVSFSGLNVKIGKGNIHRFKLRVDVVSGAGLTINADLVDGSDVTMSVKGDSYGFYITPSVSGSWTGQGGNATAVNQTINSGALVVSKSSKTPATGNITEADGQFLAVWDFEAKGEPIKISSIYVGFGSGTYGGTVGTDADGADLINCKIYDEAGVLQAGPGDGTDANDYVRFTDTWIVPIGTHSYSFYCRVYDSDADDWANGATFAVAVDPDTGITAAGYNTNNSVTPSPTTAVTGNTQTLSTAALTSTTLGSPAAQSIAVNAMDHIFATFSLSAANSGEDINVTAVIVEDTAVTGTFADIDNVEIWCDLGSSSSPRGDAYETKVSNTEQPTDTAATTDDLFTFTFTQTITVAKNSFVRCAVLGDVAAAADNGDTHTISLDEAASAVTATGADTGVAVTTAPTGAGQLMTIATSGDVTLTVDSSSPKAAIFVGGETKQTLGVFRLTANSVEDCDLDSFKITDDGSDDDVETYYFYSSSRADGGSTSDAIVTQVGGATAEVFLTDGTVVIPASGYVKITVKGDLHLVDGSTVVNGDSIVVTVAADGDVDTTGLSSGVAIDPNDTSVDAATHYVYKARPVITVDATSPSGTLSTGTSSLVAVFRVSNTDGLDDITMSAAGDDDMVFNLSGYSSGETCTSCTVTFKDKAGNLLSDAATATDLSGAIAVTDLNLDFTDNTLTVAPGDYELIKVYANTTDFTTAGNSLVVWLDDAADANFSWGIGGAVTVYETATITFRGDIYANTLGK